MAFFAKLFANNAVQFVGQQAARSLVKMAGGSLKPTQPEDLNIQCVRLTKDHDSVVTMVTYWCSLRINEMQQAGIAKETVTSIINRDAKFLNALAHALDVQKDKTPDYDAWLFFNSDIKSTNFFELQQCPRGTKNTMASFIIQ